MPTARQYVISAKTAIMPPHKTGTLSSIRTELHSLQITTGYWFSIPRNGLCSKTITERMSDPFIMSRAKMPCMRVPRMNWACFEWVKTDMVWSIRPFWTVWASLRRKYGTSGALTGGSSFRTTGISIFLGTTTVSVPTGLTTGYIVQMSLTAFCTSMSAEAAA